MFGEVAARLSGAAAALLGWRPDEFWNATPAELACALGVACESGEPPDAETMAALKARFPDD